MNIRILLLLLLAPALTQCVCARSPAHDPLRALRTQLASFQSDVIDFSASNAPSCGTTNCTNSEDCPVFSEFYERVCYQNNTCGYTPEWVDVVCNHTLQCNTGTCLCETSLSDGCTCDYYGSYGPCSDECIHGVCQPAYGNIGEYCDANFTCDAGLCINSTCQFLQEGATCNQEEQNPCAPNLYCATNNICEELPPCSEESNWNGTCPTTNEVCFNGSCVPYFGSQQLGQPCNADLFSCVAGLVCTPTVVNGTWGVCESIPEGTPCESDSECAPFTQDCLCVEHSDNAPMQCVNNRYYPCAKIIQPYNICIQSYCLYSEVTVPGNSCYDNCYSMYTALICCMVCNNQQYYDNAVFNYAGSCVDNSLKPVDCCQETYPCAILPVSDMCAGY